MRDYLQERGGRPIYADDLMGLQEAILANTSEWDGVEPFIISGCNINTGSIL